MTSYGGRFVTRSLRFRCAVSSEGSGLGASHRLLQAIESGSRRPVVSPALALEYEADETYKLAAEVAAAENVSIASCFTGSAHPAGRIRPSVWIRDSNRSEE